LTVSMASFLDISLNKKTSKRNLCIHSVETLPPT
jgi:hypothetical protein